MSAFVRQTREYQQWAKDAFFAYFETHSGNPVIAMPTGTGKSVTIADICIHIVATWNGQRILILAPTKELCEQNAAKFTGMAPQVPVGLCSASLGKYQLGLPITIGTIGTIFNRRNALGRIDLVFIDECHLVSDNDETQYRKLAEYLMSGENVEQDDGTFQFVDNPNANPNCKFVGLSATPYRLGLGHITDGGLFTDVCFDACGLEAFNWFVDQGYLLPLIPRPTRTKLDTTGVKKSGGDFVASDLQRKVNKAEITAAVVAEALELSADRKKVLWFATGIEHAEAIVAELASHGEHAVAVHSKSPTRDDDLQAFMTLGPNGVRHCVNFGVLTTGFDFPALDCIVMLRNTVSPSLWVQMLGRGTRPWYADGFDLSTQEGRLLAILNSDKQDCLVLDFAYNTAELGPINDPQLPKKKKKLGGDPPIKTCGKTGSPPVSNIVEGSGDPDKGADPKTGCGAWNHPSARHCIQCGAEFTFEVKFSHTAANTALLRRSSDDTSGAFEKPVLEEHKVTRVTYEVHRKEGRPDSIRVNYYCGLRRFSHYVLPEHGGNPRKRSEDWWTRHGGGLLPASTAQARALIDQLKTPRSIVVWMKKDFPQIMDWKFA
jgi:DNA repair protein RadD